MPIVVKTPEPLPNLKEVVGDSQRKIGMPLHRTPQELRRSLDANDFVRILPGEQTSFADEGVTVAHTAGKHGKMEVTNKVPLEDGRRVNVAKGVGAIMLEDALGGKHLFLVKDGFEISSVHPDIFAGHGVAVSPSKKVNDGLGVHYDSLTLFHGSATEGIKEMNRAEQETLGSGVYMTSQPIHALGYAFRSSEGSRRNGFKPPFVYEAELDDVTFCDLRSRDNMRKVMTGFGEYMASNWNDIISKPGLGYFQKKAIQRGWEQIRPEWMAETGILKNSLSLIGNQFRDYLQSEGYDGVLAYEHGEGKAVGTHDSYVVFDPKKLKNLTQHTHEQMVDRLINHLEVR